MISVLWEKAMESPKSLHLWKQLVLTLKLVVLVVWKLAVRQGTTTKWAKSKRTTRMNSLHIITANMMQAQLKELRQQVAPAPAAPSHSRQIWHYGDPWQRRWGRRPSTEGPLPSTTGLAGTQHQWGSLGLGVEPALSQMTYLIAVFKTTKSSRGNGCSPSTGSVYCHACKLLSPQTQQNAFISGFSNWKHSERIGDHEKSLEHRRNMLSLIQRSQVVCRVDAALVRQCESEQSEQRYWTEVLRRVVTVIKFLAGG